MRLLIILSAFFAIACSAAGSDGVKTIAVHAARVELGAAPATITLHVDRARLRDGELALRFEGLSVARRPDTVFEIHLGSRDAKPAGALSLYGVEGENGHAIRDVPVSSAAIESALGKDGLLRVVIVPSAGGDAGQAAFARLRLIRQ
ncbi:MAG: hypothetical protein QOE82_121 [Thermoanaerobaculia bacterium]|jgi:hypothetical protein|nr:hypothetical protein [Thermoanaerobaculia bacterium]